ncbi:MAG: MFS transporter [Deltaproteobacteria bacterium]|nr:MFS transporter [Deltaproteobacteria bacterium]
MSLDRLQKLHDRFLAALDHTAEGAFTGAAAAATPWPHDPTTGRELLQTLLRVRALDAAAHQLRAEGHGHYTICSTGHEANAVLGRLTGPGDPALLHYRSAAVQLERARQVPNHPAVADIARSLVAAADDPMSGGRHKVFGHPALGILPSTSTIASHLPRAVGLAFAIDRRQKLGLPAVVPPDAIAVASMGDASLNHSTAQGALNAASWVLHQKLKLPLLVVVEDNGLGISTRTPEGWVTARLAATPHLRVFTADGSDLAESFAVASEAVAYVRRTRRAAALHLRTVRLLGHAGSDADTVYRGPAELAAALERDPLLRLQASLRLAGILDAEAIRALVESVHAEVEHAAEVARNAPKLTSRAAVMAAIERPLCSATEAGDERAGQGAANLTLAQGINRALAEQLDADPSTLIFGEDVAKKGGVYGLTKGLLGRGGPARVFNTLLDEQTILGLGLGAASLGMLPVPEIQYLAYLHNAEDQLRGEAATMAFFSDGQLSNGMVVRVAGLAYQRGFGGHFHNDDAIAVLRDVPGLCVVVPARGDDAVALLRGAFRWAREAGRVVVVLEPIARYHSRDLHEDGDGGWLAAAPAGGAAYGAPRAYDVGEGPPALTIATYGNGLWMSLRVAHRLAEARGVAIRVLDLRFLVPLPTAAVIAAAQGAGRLLVVDECRQSAGVHEGIAAAVLEALQQPGAAPIRYARVSSADSFVPLGEAANLVLVGEDEIAAAAAGLLDRG